MHPPSISHNHPGRLQSKTAIVTGGSQGIGAAIVHKFVDENCNVMIFDLQPPSSPITTENEWKIESFVGDVTKAEDWTQALKATLEKFGQVDICVNNAGFVHRAMASIEVEEEEYERIMKINISPLYQSAKALHSTFAERGGGVFVNISSMSAPRPRPNLVWYAGSKGAVSSITKGLAAEYARDNIRCNAVCPVIVDTAMVENVLDGKDTPEGREGMVKGIPLGRLGRGEDVANAVAWLASEESWFVTGIELFVDGGRSLI